MYEEGFQGSHKEAGAVGVLLWIAIATRPDIASAVHEMGHDPRAHHLQVVLTILQHLRGTRELGLLYKKSQACRLVSPTPAAQVSCEIDIHVVRAGLELAFETANL